MANELANTFNEVYREYDRLRPTYPEELYCDILAFKPIDENSRALEIGIGTGQATAPILKTGCSVLAVELGKKLAEFSKNKFSSFENFSVINSSFEDFESNDEKFDLIYSATAFHWIPEECGYKKVYKLLKHGGVFARFANHPYPAKNCPVMFSAIQKVYAKYMNSSSSSLKYTEKQAKSLADISLKYGFTEITYKIYDRTRILTSDEYITLLNTYSDHIAMEESIKNAFHSGIKNAIDNFGGKITIHDTIDLQIAKRK